VVVVYLVVQIGPGELRSIWLINEGREYIEAPRWADIGIVVAVLVFFYNVAATFMKGRFTGIHPFRSAAQTVLVGGVAAMVAFMLARLIG
jgi:nitric oxide reductase subunit B